jgi:transposase
VADTEKLHQKMVRKIDAAIDFEFIRDAVIHLYCQNNGRPAIDPVRLFKMMLLEYSSASL